MIALMAFAALLLMPATSQSTRTLEWRYYVVSTPDVLGAFAGTQPGFRPPIERDVSKPTRSTVEGHMDARLEALIDTEGRTAFEHYMNAPETADGERAIQRIVETWRFTPAYLDGKPIRVRIRIQVFDRR